MIERGKRPIDDLNLAPLFAAARKALIEEEFPDGEQADLEVFMKKTKACVVGGGMVNLVSSGGLVESARSIGPKIENYSIAFSTRAGDNKFLRSMELEFLAGATLYDPQGRRIGSLILNYQPGQR